MAETSKETKPKKTSKSELTYYEGVGRRKSAIARVRIYLVKKGSASVGGQTQKAGSFTINGKGLEKVFTTLADQIMCKKPLAVTDSIDQYVVSATTSGGGAKSQIEAIMHGLSRALALIPSSDLRIKLRNEGLLTRDSRVRERRMVGTGGKARRLKQSPKR